MFGVNSIARLYKHLSKLHRKKANCAEYSSTPNKCENMYANKIAATNKRIASLKAKAARAKRTSEAEGMEGLPKGWTQSSLKKFSKSLTGKEGTKKGFFDKCVERMTGKVSNPEGFCASVKDEMHGSTYWRGKGKSPQQAGKDVKRIQNVKREAHQLLEQYLDLIDIDLRPIEKRWRG